MFNTLRINLEYIRAINTCDITTFHEFVLGKMLSLLVKSDSAERVRLLFTRKRYIWNIIRGKDFYKMMAMLIIKIMQKRDSMEEGVVLYEYIIDTTNSNDIRKEFTKAIMKETPFLTVKSIQYMSEQRLVAIVENGNYVYADGPLSVLLNRILELDTLITTQNW